jgi:hypothetical protein
VSQTYKHKNKNTVIAKHEKNSPYVRGRKKQSMKKKRKHTRTKKENHCYKPLHKAITIPNLANITKIEPNKPNLAKIQNRRSSNADAHRKHEITMVWSAELIAPPSRVVTL